MKKCFLILFLLCAQSVSAEMHLLAFAGSTRQESYNKQLVKQAVKIAESMGAKVTYVDLRDYEMPLYDADLEAHQGLPKNAKRFRDLMLASDGFIISTPEYNSGVSAVLKNTLDWSSRSPEKSYSNEPFKGKRFALMSASPGGGGGKSALAVLTSVIQAVGGVAVLPQVSVAQAYSAFDEEGNLKNSDLQRELREEIKALIKG